MNINLTDKEITIICVSYKRYQQINVLINSLLCQTLSNWKLLVIHDGHDARMGREIKRYTTEHPNIKYMETDRRYNDYGHSLREIGIKMAETPYIMITNDDNYYTPKFLEYMFETINEHNLDIVLCNFVSSHDFSFLEKPPSEIYTNVLQSPDGKYVQLAYNVINSIPRKHCVDIGNFIVKTPLAKQAGFRDKSSAGDGTFVEDIMSLNSGRIRAGKVHKVLFVHN